MLAKLKFLFKREVITRGSNFTVRSPKVCCYSYIIVYNSIGRFAIGNVE